ncbi:hypothetical protein NCER_100729 [Vairimorpha ceranae BRL01]|uniref:Uncharacterized protein n=1 Tax=Vairimorpha ceranae (strain BRL01) TaxID=578460 RepID=C4V8B8_VAIC1|nr:hypothetical protein NCER_100729 [Vairimorpha ceranae BRL01]
MVVRAYRSKKYDFYKLIKPYTNSFLFLKINTDDITILQVILTYFSFFILISIAILIKYDNIILDLVVIHSGLLMFYFIFSLFIYIFINRYSYYTILFIVLLSFIHLPIYIVLYRYAFFRPIVMLTYLILQTYFVRKNFDMENDLITILCTIFYFLFYHICIN